LAVISLKHKYVDQVSGLTEIYVSDIGSTCLCHGAVT
jgi:hypothetical protein